MAKLMTMFFVLICIQAVLMLYAGQDAADTQIVEMVFNMQNWGSTAFILSVLGIAAGIGLIGFAAASTFGFKTDFLIFAPAIAGFVSMGVVLTSFAMFIKKELIAYALYCAPDLATATLASCLVSQQAVANFVIAITIGPLGLYYTWTIVEWWRGKDY